MIAINANHSRLTAVAVCCLCWIIVGCTSETDQRSIDEHSRGAIPTNAQWSRGLALSPDGQHLCHVNHSGEMEVYDPQSEKLQFTVPLGNQINGIAFSPDGRLLLGLSDESLSPSDSNMYLVNPATWECTALASKPLDRTDLLWEADSKHWQCVASSDKIERWRLQDDGTAKLVAETPLPEDYRSFEIHAISTDGRCAVYDRDEDSVICWRRSGNSWLREASTKSSSYVRLMKFIESGARLIFVTADGAILEMNTNTGMVRECHPATTGADTFAVSADGQYIALAGQTREKVREIGFPHRLGVHKVSSGEIVYQREWEGPVSVIEIAFSQSGSMAYSVVREIIPAPAGCCKFDVRLVVIDKL